MAESNRVLKFIFLVFCLFILSFMIYSVAFKGSKNTRDLSKAVYPFIGLFCAIIAFWLVGSGLQNKRISAPRTKQLIHKDSNPTLYWILVAIYSFIGIISLIFSLRSLFS